MTKEELLRRLDRSEWSDFECKKSQRGVSDDAFPTVSAFANTAGGTIVFGIQDTLGNLEPVGVLEPDKVQNDFLSTLRSTGKLNRIIRAKEERFEIDGKTLLVFHIPEAPRSEKPVYIGGDIRKSYIRRGASDERCTMLEIERFLRDASTVRYDNTVVDYNTKECFDGDSVAWYRNRYEKIHSNRPYSGVNDEEFLFQLGLIREIGTDRKPTIASLLMFRLRRLSSRHFAAPCR